MTQNLKVRAAPGWIVAGSLCTGMSAISFYLSTGLGEIWVLGWFAPVPLLWLTYARCPTWIVILATLIAFVLGQLGFLEGFAGLRTATLMVSIAIVSSAALFAAAILAGRLAQRRLHPLLAVGAFPAAWTSMEYLVSLLSPNGTVGSLAYTQVGAPVLIQGASLLGPWFITFLLCFVASCTALALVNRKQGMLIGGIGIAAFSLNLAFGSARLLEPRTDSERVAVAAIDLPDRGYPSNRDAWVGLAMEYATRARELATQGATTIVFPEKLALLRPEWREAVLAPIALAAREAGVRIVAGFEDQGFNARNIALTFWPNGAVSTYVKRRLILGLDHNVIPGDKSGILGGGFAVAICKDMDYPSMIRSDAQRRIRLMLVPAEDFFVDHWMHERIAILRGVENGFSVARAARKGDIMISDAHGRILTLAKTSAALQSRLVDVPLGSNDTLYLKIGDAFAWLCLATTMMFLVFCVATIKKRHVAEWQKPA